MAHKELRFEEIKPNKVAVLKYDLPYERLEVTEPGLTQFIFDVPDSNVSKKVDVVLKVEGAEAEVLGSYVGNGNQEIDLEVNSIHEVPNTRCLTQIRGVMTDHSDSKFKGMIVIREGAQKTASYLDHDVLILGKNAKNQSEPGLEIEADDVKATHGATTGRILDEHLFYLMSRGISKKESEKLVIEGFLSPAVEKVQDEEVKNYLSIRLQKAIEQAC